MGQQRAEVTIKGRVQGVFFRQSTRETAESLGITGWVHNLPNGDVEAVFEGTPEALKQMLAWCRKGPSAARVEEVLTRHEDASGEFSVFRIR